MRLDRHFAGLALVLVSACASAPKGPYVAGKLEAPPKSVAPAPPAPTVRPGQMQRVPGPEPFVPGTPPHKDQPQNAIARANSGATKLPDPQGYFNSIMTFDFEPGALYQVYAAPYRITDVRLQPGEHLIGKPAAGDTTRWVLGLAKSVELGVDTQHIYLKPTRPGIRTTLVLNTDRRTYHIELEAYRETYMVAVAWNYPADDMRTVEGHEAANDKDKAVTANHVALDALNFAYHIEVIKGEPHFVPVQAFDDGRKTYLRFSPDMLVREAPALFVLSRGNETQLVNYRMKNDTYVVDRLFDAAELRLGEQKQDIVRITRTGSAPHGLTAHNNSSGFPFGP